MKRVYSMPRNNWSFEHVLAGPNFRLANLQIQPVKLTW